MLGSGVVGLVGGWVIGSTLGRKIGGRGKT
jgi:hypothetical protein